MKVQLIFPPQWLPYRPYLSTPSLAAYLVEHGVDVVQLDFNIECYDIMLSEKYLLSLETGLNDRFQAFELKESLLPGPEQQEYTELFLAKAALSSVAAGVDGAKAVLRDASKYYDPGELARARMVLEQALSIVSAAHFPTHVRLNTLEMPHGVNFSGLEDITSDRKRNPYIRLTEERLIQKIRSAGAGIIGVSIVSETQLVPALTVCHVLKGAFPDAHIVIGGYVVTMLAEILPRHPRLFLNFFDSAITAEGERPLIELVKCPEQKKPLHSVPNLIWCDGGEVVVNENTDPIAFNLLPTPCFDGLDLKSYFSPSPALPLQASRGCYWDRCAFCSHTAAHGCHYQPRDVQLIIRDMQALTAKYGNNTFVFCDEGISPSVMDRLCDELIRRGISIHASTNVRLEPRFTRELCAKAARAGFDLFYLGLESGNDRVLLKMDKGIRPDTALSVIESAFLGGIWDHLYAFIGFPTETAAEARDTFNFLATNMAHIRSFNLGSFSLSKGSCVYTHPDDFGIRVKAPVDDFSLQLDYETITGLDNKEAEALSRSFWHELTGLFPDKALMRITQEDLLQYIAHYGSPEKAEAVVLSAFNRGRETIPTQPISITSRPMLRSKCAVHQMRFPLPLFLFSNHEPSVLYPGKSSIIVSWTDTVFRHRALTPHESEIIRLCDGVRSVAQIAVVMAEKHSAPHQDVEDYTLAFLGKLCEQGFTQI